MKLRLTRYALVCILLALFAGSGANPAACNGSVFVLSGATPAAGTGDACGEHSSGVEGVPTGYQAVLCAGNRMPSVDQVLERYVNAVGGREAVEKLKTRTIKCRFIKDLHWDDPPYEDYRIVIFAKSQGKTLIDEHKPGGRRQEGFDGEENWVKDKDGVELRDRMYIRKLAWICNPQGALRVEQYFPDLTVNHEKSGAGSSFYVLESSELGSDNYALYFDKKTGLLKRIGYHWDIKDYKKVDGVLMPHQVVTGRKGGSCTYEFQTVTHNTPVPDAMFSSSGWYLE